MTWILRERALVLIETDKIFQVNIETLFWKLKTICYFRASNKKKHFVCICRQVENIFSIQTSIDTNLEKTEQKQKTRNTFNREACRFGEQQGKDTEGFLDQGQVKVH